MVMGWQDYHLHQFASGRRVHDPEAENYVMPAGLAEGIVGIDERRVRLDEVLVGPGDRLFPAGHDFGDSWSHTLDLEEVMDRSPGADPARCVGGEWACPPEDCGGIGRYAHLLQILADQVIDHGELRRWAGADFDPAHFEQSR